MKGRTTVIKYKKEWEMQIRLRLDEYGDMLHVQDIADILGVVKECARRRIVSGQIKSVATSNNYVVAKEWLIEYLDTGNLVREPLRQFQTKRDKIVEFCKEPRSRQEIQDHFGYSTKEYMRKVLTSLIGEGRLAYTEKPHHRNQKYIAKQI
jgi:predicted ArsR family transcriptional regulator